MPGMKPPGPRRIVPHILLLTLGLPAMAATGEPQSPQYRLIGASPASVSALPSSPAYQLLLVGGSGQAAGISASSSASVVAGANSTRLPTERIFRNGME